MIQLYDLTKRMWKRILRIVTLHLRARGRGVMARPIAATPKLDAQSSEKFLNKVEQNLKPPARHTPTPKVDNMIRVMMADATISRQN
jgi:hypothetical protein